jgi:hypothetical protein
MASNPKQEKRLILNKTKLALIGALVLGSTAIAYA